MKAANRGAGNRSLLNNNGKGSADRTDDMQSFRRNFDGIFFNCPPDGFFVTAHGRSQKVYGPSASEAHGFVD